jgi:hypothetical protein
MEKSTMVLTVKGGTKLQKELARELVTFVKDKYLSNYTTLDIELTIKKNLSEETGAEGFCFAVESARPRTFEIEIDKDLSITKFIKTVIHELVHVRQYAKGELIDYSRGRAKVSWKGKDYTKTSYSRQPWERQAYRLQESLYNEFMIKE